LTDQEPKRSPPRAAGPVGRCPNWETRLGEVLRELTGIQGELLQLLSARGRGELSACREDGASHLRVHQRLGERLAACRGPLDELLDADTGCDALDAADFPAAVLVSWLRDQQELLRLSRRLELLLA
jgi:hypothetical protein